MPFLIVLLIILFGTDPVLAQSRGEYLAKLGDCTSCHTAPGHKEFSGGLTINSPFGIIYSTNITPDKEYGIGDYSLQDFSRALRQGIAKGGSYLYPAMPYTSFTGASEEDIAALYAYFMQEVKPVHEKPPETHLPFPLNQRWGIRFWNFFFLHDKPFTPTPNRDEAWNRGAYLAQTFGHCSACHTPRGIFYEEKGAPSSKLYLTGQTLDHWYAPDLRDDAASGLGAWSENDIAGFLQNGHAHGSAAFGNMAQVVENSTQYLTDADRLALAHYLKSLSARGENASYDPTTAKPTKELPGAGLYASACASCHGMDGAGKPPRFPKLAGNPAVLSNDATSIIRLVLEGGSAPAIPAKMPGFAAKWNDREIADVISYIRQSWGNHAASISERDVQDLRRALKE